MINGNFKTNDLGYIVSSDVSNIADPKSKNILITTGLAEPSINDPKLAFASCTNTTNVPYPTLKFNHISNVE